MTAGSIGKLGGAMRQLAGVLASLTAAAVLDGCMGTTDIQVVDKIDHLQAYYCATPNQDVCTDRGDPIPDGALPPITESFQVWAFYQGWVSTYWQLNTNGDSTKSANKFEQDSTHVWINLNGGGASSYTVHVFIKNQVGLITATDDSLRWTFK